MGMFDKRGAPRATYEMQSTLRQSASALNGELNLACCRESIPVLVRRSRVLLECDKLPWSCPRKLLPIFIESAGGCRHLELFIFDLTNAKVRYNSCRGSAARAFVPTFYERGNTERQNRNSLLCKATFHRYCVSLKLSGSPWILMHSGALSPAGAMSECIVMSPLRSAK
jgi:hypothetical protein